MFYKGLLYSIIYIPYKGIPNLARRQNSGKKGEKKIRPGAVCTSCPTTVVVVKGAGFLDFNSISGSKSTYFLLADLLGLGALLGGTITAIKLYII